MLLNIFLNLDKQFSSQLSLSMSVTILTGSLNQNDLNIFLQTSHLTPIVDLTYSANKHRSQFSKGTFTPSMIICHVDIWLRLECAGVWNRSTMGIFCAANTGLGTELTALRIDNFP